MSDTGVEARRSAIFLLDQILGETPRLMSEVLAGGALDKLLPDDRARAQRLALDTLRGLERADRLLQKHLKKPPPLTVRNALRLGTVELCQGGAAHGVVNAVVTIVSRIPRLGHLKGLANAVLLAQHNEVVALDTSRGIALHRHGVDVAVERVEPVRIGFADDQ